MATHEGLAFVVVDMQPWCCDRDTPLGRLLAYAGQGHDWYYEQLDSTVIPNIARLLDHYRSEGAVVCYTAFGSRRPDGSDLPPWAARHNQMALELVGEHCYPTLDHPTARVIEALEPKGETVFEKSTSGPLAGTEIVGFLRSASIGRVVVSGVATDVCVMGMCRELADSGFDVAFVVDACATPQQQSHEWAIRLLGTTFARAISAAEAMSLS
jgi:nicotinamidase-related amidase